MYILIPGLANLLNDGMDDDIDLPSQASEHGPDGPMGGAGSGLAAGGGGSRFSQFFQKPREKTPPQQQQAQPPAGNEMAKQQQPAFALHQHKVSL